MTHSLAADIAAITRISAVPSILEVVVEATGMRYAVIARVTQEAWVACAVLDRMEFGLGVGGELEVATTLCSEVRDRGEAIVIEHASEDRHYGGHPTPKRYGIESYIAFPIFRRDGEFFGTLCAIDARPAKLSDAGLLTTMKLFSELIAAQLDAEERHKVIAESEARFRSLFDSAAVPTLLQTPAGVILQANRAACAFFGYAEEDLRQKAFRDVIHADDAMQVEDHFNRLLTGASDTHQSEQRFVRPSGEVRWALMSTTVLRDDRQAPQALLAQLQDLTARKQAEAAQAHLLAELQRVNEKLQQFSYIVSHDLNEPLRTMSSFLSLLACEYQGKLDATADKYMGFVTDGAQRMQGMITDLLAYTGAGGQALTLAPVDSEELLARVLRDLHKAIVEAKAEITYDSLPTVQGDATRLGQVWQNLIGNALKFRGQAPPRIHASAVKEGSYWQFSIRDNGIGIDPHQAQRLFQVFQRLHTRREYPGTGIGLAICKKIIERHGGRIWVESAPGTGTTFFFTLPSF
jgi:PAS domain S-box-containing protein